MAFGPESPDHAAPAFSDPWTQHQVVTAQELSKELLEKHTGVILQVGVLNLYNRGHIPGSIYAGPASSPQGLEKLRAELRKIPSTRSIIIYCGCCPERYCPNIRPAFELVQELGFKNVRVLSLPNDFGQDWLQKGYPVERDKT